MDAAPRPADPGTTYALYQHGCAQLDAGNPWSAVEVLELAAEREPGQACVREALARAYFAASRVRLARGEFERALELDPTDDYAHFGIGRCFEREGRLPDAAKYFKLACALADRSVYQHALARVQQRLQR